MPPHNDLELGNKEYAFPGALETLSIYLQFIIEFCDSSEEKGVFKVSTMKSKSAGGKEMYRDS